jgi:D-aminoacyl-tRNA deacylase
MKLLIQRVKSASVMVDKKIVGSIKNGALVFFGSKQGDVKENVKYLSEKLINLRIFSDEDGKMNLSIKDKKYDVLVVSQFTLYADCSKGRRPSFIFAQDPKIAKEYYDEFVGLLKKDVSKVETGVFGAMMEVSLINDGPATFIIESK